ncbi:MAG: hypothetical protein JO352_29645 [Chloroflexi bacterium]|nr:hypothetical protein [Chloroflexota bacterium]
MNADTLALPQFIVSVVGLVAAVAAAAFALWQLVLLQRDHNQLVTELIRKPHIEVGFSEEEYGAPWKPLGSLLHLMWLGSGTWLDITVRNTGDREARDLELTLSPHEPPPVTDRTAVRPLRWELSESEVPDTANVTVASTKNGRVTIHKPTLNIGAEFSIVTYPIIFSTPEQEKEWSEEHGPPGMVIDVSLTMADASRSSGSLFVDFQRPLDGSVWVANTPKWKPHPWST